MCLNLFGFAVFYQGFWFAVWFLQMLFCHNFKMSTSIFAFSEKKPSLHYEKKKIIAIFLAERILMERIRGQDSVQECIVVLTYNFNGMI